MILQLLGTLLLTAFDGCMSVDTQRSNAPIKENTFQVMSPNYYNGGYVLKYVDTPTDIYFNHRLFDHNVLFEYRTPNNFDYRIYCPNFDEDYNLMNSLYPVTYFSLSYDSASDRVLCEYTVENSDVISGFGFDINDTFDDGLYYNVDSDYLAIYFDYPCYFNDEVRVLFETLFTSTVNSHYTRYKGWYSFNNPYRVHDVHFEVYTSMLAKNSLYDFMLFNTSFDSVSQKVISLYNSKVLLNDPEYEPLAILRFGQIWNQNVYFNNLFVNDDIFAELLYSGVFSYTEPNTQYGLDDLFFNIADTPVIFITRLFSFTIFGVEFYIAFMGIITAIAMIYIIRKIL